MRDILELCVEIDDLAHDTYVSLAKRCEDPEVSEVLAELAAEEGQHAGWWRELLDAWEQGLMPDIWADTITARTDMQEILDAMKAVAPGSDGSISADAALTTAVKVEFFMLDPMFGELLDLAEPAVASARHEAYQAHLERLVSAVEEHYEARDVAGFLARVLRRSWRENRSLAHFAMRDPLTGLANRRAFAARLRQWIAWSCRYGHPLTVLLLDLDRFKDVNDMYGHAAGDELLRLVARALIGATRASDMAARYGGDEFAVLAPETDPEEARALVDRILESVRSIRMPAGEDVIHPTVSLGSAVMLEPADSEPRDPDELLAGADQGLYAAKQAGRDRASDPTLLLTPIL